MLFFFSFSVDFFNSVLIFDICVEFARQVHYSLSKHGKRFVKRGHSSQIMQQGKILNWIFLFAATVLKALPHLRIVLS